MAFAVYNSPGVYALLLGSGVSRAAEIPTGWEIVQDLIRQIAAAHDEVAPENPVEWYEERFGKEPRYDDLIAILGPKPSQRSATLRRYFEASEEELERNTEMKRPTRAHRAIAHLIRDGCICVVLTTNFDRLLEGALGEIGIVPDVISTDNALQGARPPQHSRISIYKLHGDYRDESFKNIPGELEEYSDPCNDLLDRILDEYGLIVCGWSADWDAALRKALERAKARRYATFWSFYSEPSEVTQRLMQHRDAQLIGPISADELFVELHQAVEALRSYNRGHPLSVKVAVERTKKLMPGENTQIELEELFRSEVERAYTTFTSQDFESQLGDLVNRPTIAVVDMWKDILSLFPNVCEIPLNMAAALAWYGKPQQAAQIRYAMRRWIEKPTRKILALQWQYLPSLFLMYICGIAAVHRNNWAYLSAIFCNIRGLEEEVNKYLSVFDIVILKTMKAFADSQGSRGKIPLGMLIQDLLRPVFVPYLPSLTEYVIAFDIFESLLAVLRLHETNKDSSYPYSVYGIPQAGAYSVSSLRSHEHILEFWKSGGQQGADWGLLQAGLFDGDPQVLRESLTLHQGRIAETTDIHGFTLHIPEHYIDAYNQAGE